MKFINDKIFTFLILFFLAVNFSQISSNKKRKSLKKNSPVSPVNNNPSQSNCNTAPLLINNDKKFIIDYHNKLRNQIASKTINWKSIVNFNDYFPFASNMLQMYWDNELENQAQAYANQCKLEHSSYQDRIEKKFKSNESIFFRRFKSGKPNKPDFGKAISFWFDQIKKFVAMKKNVSSFNYQGVNVDYFAQIIWAKTYKIGCGYSVFQNPKDNYYYELYVCLYGNNTGLQENKPIYEASNVKKCDCPLSTGCNNANYNSLCCPIGFCTGDALNYIGPNLS